MVLVTVDAYCTMIVTFYQQLSTIYLQAVDGQNWGVRELSEECHRGVIQTML